MIFKSKKQKQLEKEQKAAEEKAKKTVLFKWMFVVFLALLAIGTAPSFAMVLFIILAVAIVPIPAIQQLWDKIPIRGKWFKPTVLVIVFFIAACMMPKTPTEDGNEVAVVEEVDSTEESEEIESETTEVVTTTEPSSEETALPEITATTEPVASTEPEPEPIESKTPVVASSAPEVSVTDIPAYSGKAYVEVNGNVPYFTDGELTTASYEYYSDLDSLGRCGVCSASIGQDIMPTEERGSIGSVKPSGWVNVKYAGVVDGNYLYNRCHLIGYQLTGENANTKNLITGTRYLNIEGMLPFENMVADYIKETNNHVLYRVTPMFSGNNLVADGVLMEAKSVEDNGEGILYNVYCYNVQPGVKINYADGTSELDGTVSTQSDTTNNSSSSTSTSQSSTSNSTDNETVTQPTDGENSGSVTVPTASETGENMVWVPTNGGTKYHSKSTCSNMKDPIQVTKETAEANGYTPCGRCW